MLKRLGGISALWVFSIRKLCKYLKEKQNKIGARGGFPWYKSLREFSPIFRFGSCWFFRGRFRFQWWANRRKSIRKRGNSGRGAGGWGLSGVVHPFAVLTKSHFPAQLCLVICLFPNGNCPLWPNLRAWKFKTKVHPISRSFSDPRQLFPDPPSSSRRFNGVASEGNTGGNFNFYLCVKRKLAEESVSFRAWKSN